MGSSVAGALIGARACPADSKILIRIENSLQLNRNISNSKSLARRSQVVPTSNKANRNTSRVIIESQVAFQNGSFRPFLLRRLRIGSFGL